MTIDWSSLYSETIRRPVSYQFKFLIASEISTIKKKKTCEVLAQNVLHYFSLTAELVSVGCISFSFAKARCWGLRDCLFFPLSVQQMAWLGTNRHRWEPECCPTQLVKTGWVVWIFPAVKCLDERFQLKFCPTLVLRTLDKILKCALICFIKNDKVLVLWLQYFG